MMPAPALPSPRGLRQLSLASLLAWSLAAAFGPTAAHAETPDHTFEVKVEAAKGATPGTIAFVITPAPPWKWNAEYPAKLTLTAPDGVVLGKPVLKAQEGDFTTKDSRVNAQTSFSGGKAGAQTATVTAKFGLCNGNVCITKKVETTAALQVTR